MQWRRGAARDVIVSIGEFVPEKTASSNRAEPGAPKGNALAQSWGLQVSALSAEQQRELNLKGGVHVDVATDAAARAGLREGDVITAVANIEIRSLDDFEKVISRADHNRPISILFRRGEWAQYTLIRPVK